MSFQSLFSSLHVFLYRASKGRIGGRFRGGPVLLLTTTGRRTGKKRTTPLLFQRNGNRLVVVASNSGRRNSPAWWINIQSNREAEVQIKDERWIVKAEKATDDEKPKLWQSIIDELPFYEKYQQKTKRVIPIVTLSPVSKAEVPRIPQ